MPLILRITSLLRDRHPAMGGTAWCIGVVGNSRIRAVTHYGKAGFEVSWQVTPAATGGDHAQEHAGA